MKRTGTDTWEGQAEVWTCEVLQKYGQCSFQPFPGVFAPRIWGCEQISGETQLSRHEGKYYLHTHSLLTHQINKNIFAKIFVVSPILNIFSTKSFQLCFMVIKKKIDQRGKSTLHVEKVNCRRLSRIMELAFIFFSSSIDRRRPGKWDQGQHFLRYYKVKGIKICGGLENVPQRP